MHHHPGLWRTAGLVSIRDDEKQYRLQPERLSRVAALLEDFLDSTQEREEAEDHVYVAHQELARYRCAELVEEAAHEHTSSHLYRWTAYIPRPPAIVRRVLAMEPDFVAIRRDLRFTLSEWCLDTDSGQLDAIADIVMRRLRRRPGHNDPPHETDT
jgi:hypothetical protein